MKHLVFAAAMLMGSLFAHADGKIAVVNIEMAIFNTEVVKAKGQQLQADPAYKKNLQDIQAIQDSAKQLIEKVKKEGPTMSAQQKQQAESEMASKKSDMEHLAKKLKEAEAMALQPIMYQLQPQAVNAVKEIVAAEGIGLLLNASAQTQTVIHADTSFDITAKVTDKLNKLNKK